MSLRVYTVHLPPERTRRWQALDPLPELVKEGFAWPAFLFGFVWALYHKLWLLAALLVALVAGLGVVFEELRLDELSASLVFFAVSVIVGLLGNDSRRRSLRRRGYRDGGVVTAGDVETALRRYLDLHAIGGTYGGSAPRATPTAWPSPDAGPWGAPKP